MRTVKITKKTTTTLEITGAEIRKAFKLPYDADLTVRVPGGGDWSNTDLVLDECPVKVTYTVVEEREE